MPSAGENYDLIQFRPEVKDMAKRLVAKMKAEPRFYKTELHLFEQLWAKLHSVTPHATTTPIVEEEAESLCWLLGVHVCDDPGALNLLFATNVWHALKFVFPRGPRREMLVDRARVVVCFEASDSRGCGVDERWFHVSFELYSPETMVLHVLDESVDPDTGEETLEAYQTKY